MEQDDHHHHEYYACLPQWLESLLDEKFFVPCYIHEDARKNEKNVFCLDCCTSVCTHCCPSIHDSHRLLQVRRYIYKDVLRLDDIQKLIDCSHVQVSSTINHQNHLCFLKINSFFFFFLVLFFDFAELYK